MRSTLAAALALSLVAAAARPAAAQEDETIRVALGDIASVETLHVLAALERARQRGLDIELIEFNDEDIANQAVINDQADIGIGVPYTVIQNAGAPVRMIYQIASLRFFPVVDKAAYPDWRALNGGDFAVQGRGSGTEAMARVIEQTEGIEFGNISFVPGSEVRALALLQGNVKATFLDIANKNFVMSEAPDRFHELPMPDVNATDEALFARQDWIAENPEAVRILLEELLAVTQAINADPGAIVAMREELNLLPDLPEELEAEIGPYYEQAVEAGLFPNEGGNPDSAAADFAFYTVAGQLQGAPEELRAEDFWDFGPLEQARAAGGG